MFWIERATSGAVSALNIFSLNFINNLFEFSFNDYSDVCVLNQNAKRKFSSNDNWDLIISGGEFGFSENELAFLRKKLQKYGLL